MPRPIIMTGYSNIPKQPTTTTATQKKAADSQDRDDPALLLAQMSLRLYADGTNSPLRREIADRIWPLLNARPQQSPCPLD
jgi:hypothetical protein